MSSSIFSLTPTFTQGLILGQLSIFLLLALILKFLFFETATTTSSSQARPPGLSSLSHQTHTTQNVPLSVSLNPNDSTEWFNVILHNVCVFIFSYIARKIVNGRLNMDWALGRSRRRTGMNSKEA